MRNVAAATDVEPSPARSACVDQRPADERGRARGETPELGRQPLAAMVSDRGVGDAQALAQLDRLRKVARGHAHVVTICPQALDHRAHDEHMRAVGQVDPDAHGMGR